MKVSVSVAGECERFEFRFLNRNGKLFLQLAYKRSLWRLARLYLAARKLPQASQLLALRPLGQQDFALLIIKRDGDHQNETIAHLQLMSGRRH